MGDQLADLLGRNAVIEGALEMTFELLGTVQGDEGGAGYQAAVALGELRPFPHIAEENAFGELDEFGYRGAHLVAGGRRRGRFCGHEGLFPWIASRTWPVQTTAVGARAASPLRSPRASLIEAGKDGHCRCQPAICEVTDPHPAGVAPHSAP